MPSKIDAALAKAHSQLAGLILGVVSTMTTTTIDYDDLGTFETISTSSSN